MKRLAAIFILVVVMAVWAVVLRVLSRPAVSGDQADRLELTGVWVIKGGAAGEILSVGVRNAGATSLKAFRAKLLKRNDFNEDEEAATVEHSIDTGYVSKDGKRESRHLLVPGETMFLNTVEGSGGTRRYSSGISAVHAQFAAFPRSNELDALQQRFRAEGYFILKVTDVVTADAEEASAASRRGEHSTSAHPLPSVSTLPSRAPDPPTPGPVEAEPLRAQPLYDPYAPAATETPVSNEFQVRALKKTYVRVVMNDEANATWEGWLAPPDAPKVFRGQRLVIKTIEQSAIELRQNGLVVSRSTEDVRFE